MPPPQTQLRHGKHGHRCRASELRETVEQGHPHMQFNDLTLKGAPRERRDLLQHDCLRIKPDMGLRSRQLRLFRSDRDDEVLLDVKPVLWANHTDTLMRAAIDGAGITGTTVELAAPHLSSGALVRVLSPWITGRFTLYAALPSRKFLPQRTQVIPDHLTEKTRERVAQAIAGCAVC